VPAHADDYELRRVSNSDMIGWRGKRAFVSKAIAHDVVDLKQVSDGAWEIYFGPILLGMRAP
jgi:hypothetical protein